MNEITILADIKVKPDHIEMVKSELLKLLEPSRKEEGCINYDLHQDNENPAHFVFYENWVSRELWQQHSNNKHIVDYKKTIDGALESVTITEMSHIE